METTYRRYVGIDWATLSHQVCLIDSARRVLDERQVEHSGRGLEALVAWLTAESEGVAASTAIAIETPRGAVVELLVERGFHVFVINPKQLDRFRDRHGVAGSKDDRRDAFVLADSLRTDEASFRRVSIDTPEVIQLRELSRVDQELEHERCRLANQLREQLWRYFPQLLGVCPAADEAWLWALLERASTPQRASELTEQDVHALLRTHRVRRIKAADLVAKLRGPALQLAPGTVEAASEHALMLVPRLRTAHEQRLRCGRRMESLLRDLKDAGTEQSQQREHRDVEILRSLPGVGRLVAATMLAEAGGPLRERNYHALRTLTGVAPVTRQSGRSKRVLMRRGCNARLRRAVYHWAASSVRTDPTCRRRYSESRKRGHRHGRAVRGLADHLIRILVAMLRSGTLYDAAKTASAREFAASAVAPD